MTTKSQLQSKIQELESELQSFKTQLNNYQEVTLQTSSVGDILEDGSIVLQKSDGLALLVAPSSTEVFCKWSQEFPEVYDKLKEHGFNPSQWFVPTQEQLQLAYSRLKIHFTSTKYWSSTERTANTACLMLFFNGTAISSFKTYTYCVRAFRCVTY